MAVPALRDVVLFIDWYSSLSGWQRGDPASMAIEQGWTTIGGFGIGLYSATRVH